MTTPPSPALGPRSYTCQLKRNFGKEFCLHECPSMGTVFTSVRIATPGDVPPAEDRTIDVAVLDMNHGWPNLGHDSLVQAVRDAACDLIPVLQPNELRVRVLSFDVRQRHVLPDAPNGRYVLYLGTGGPGHIDPHRNDGTAPGSQGIHEDPAWEAPLFRLYDAIRADDEASLIAVCHSFGVLCRWSDIAKPVLRSEEKGGKSAGVLENILTDAARRHPWFGRFARELPDHRHLRVIDHRLFDLIPHASALGGRAVPIGYETAGVGGPEGEALTMVEWARDREGVMPRIFAVNHHPEIVDRSRQMLVLREKLARGEVTPEWYEDRARVLTETYPDDARDQRLQLTSDFTLMGPMRFHLYRQIRRRAEALGLEARLHEDEVLADDGAAVSEGAGAA